MSLEANRNLRGKYRIVSRIAGGGTVDIYSALHTQTHDEIAIVMPPRSNIERACSWSACVLGLTTLSGFLLLRQMPGRPVAARLSTEVGVQVDGPTSSDVRPLALPNPGQFSKGLAETSERTDAAGSPKTSETAPEPVIARARAACRSNKSRGADDYDLIVSQ
jgi:hypothetical protein